MSTIKSSAENLTLNADGSGNDISMQSNAAEKLKLTAEGNLHLQGSDSRIQLNAQGGANVVGNNTVHIRGDGTSMKLMTASGGDYIYEVNGSEKMRIDSSGKVGIGQTTPASNNSSPRVLHIGSSGDSKASIVLEENGSTGSNTWEILSDDELQIRRGSSQKMYFKTDGLAVFNNGVALGGTGAANTLDDYEIGTWTAGFDGASKSGGNSTGYYTKIGRQVFVQWYSAAITISNQSGVAHITGLPFTSSNASAALGLFTYQHGNALDGGTTGGYIGDNGTTMRFVDADAYSGASFRDGANMYIMIAGSYFVN